MALNKQGMTPENWNYDDAGSGTAAAVLTTDQIGSVCPYDTLVFTKSAATENVTLTVKVWNGKGVVVISGLTGETVAITGTINSVTTGNVLARVSGTPNTIAEAATLGNGTHTLVF
tara:strand:+ start:3868 stop:4215 length:348 start_codon:yes stop_codon:yes gene_type:complete